MLQIETPFPNPGSTALFDGFRWRVMRHNADGTALLSREGDRASFNRTAPVADLVDPAVEDLRLDGATLSHADARRALWIARRLRRLNEVSIADLDFWMRADAVLGQVPVCDDRAHIARLLRQLGWARTSVQHGGGAMRIIYARAPHARAARGEAA
jgi:hypothetical protein